jgi:3-hydroxyisobutyrate dehydrogenase-like beta-hydroxyacid dehydrogenase
MTTITLLHPGAMGAAVGGEAVAAGHEVLWVSAARSEASAARADHHGLVRVPDLSTALARSDTVLSICPPANAEEVSRAVAEEGFRGTYVDANAISPDRMERIAALQREAGASPVDGAIIGSPPSRTVTPRLYLAGDAAAVVASLFEGTQVHTRAVDRPVGSVSALKMAYGGFQKASRALAAVAHALAREFAVQDELVAEGRAMTTGILGAPEQLPSAAAKGWRWAPEMEEVAHTLDLLDLPSDLALGAAAVMRRWERDKDDLDVTVADLLAHLKG